MSVQDVFDNTRERLILPFLGPFYDKIAQPMAWSIFRLAIGCMLIVEGWPKIMDPMGQIGFVEGLGFHPGWFWSPLLAGLQVLGGFLIAIGLFTRPAALACGVMLAVTIWFHVTHPYGDALLTQAGIDALNAGSDFFTPNGLARLKDGGGSFLHQVQSKAEFNSLFWTGGTFLYAAFGGGYLSLERLLFRKRF